MASLSPPGPINPRPHYLLLPTMLLLFLSAVFLGHVPDRQGQRWIPALTTGIGLGLVGLMATQAVAERIAEPPPWERSIRALQAIPDGVRIVSVDERVCVFIANCVALPQPSPSDLSLTFDDYLNINEVNAVLTVPILLDSGWGRMSGVPEFLSTPEGFGFSTVVERGPIAMR